MWFSTTNKKWGCAFFLQFKTSPYMTEQFQPRLEDLPLNRGVRVLESNDDGLVALEKPDGAMSHPNTSTDIERSLFTASYDYAGEFYFWEDDEGNEKRAWLINRLDSPTSGVILLGLNPDIAAAVKSQFATHKISKIYYALVRHVPPNGAGTWVDMINKDLVNNGRLIKQGRRIEAKTNFQVVTKPTGGFPITLIKLMPITGRTHQLRVQCRKHGHAIVGDRTYGNFRFNKEVVMETGEKRMMLHSGETIVNYTYKGRVCTFRAKSEIPEAFHHVLGFRPGMSPAKAVRLDKAEKKQSALAGRRFKQA
ncbi:MAG: RluA family pseudouridine synthase [Opitutales bacterium]